MNSYERKRRICKVIVLVLGILSINNIILTIRNYSYAYFEKNVKTGVKLKITTLDEMPNQSMGNNLLLAETKASNVEEAKKVISAKGTPDFSSVATTNEGMYKTADNLGDSYYYRGAVTNNNVYFGGYYWKIVRINGDGTIKLVYVGTTPNATGTNASISEYIYSNGHDATHAGYMYGENFTEQTKDVIYKITTSSTENFYTSYYTKSGNLFALSGSSQNMTFLNAINSSYKYYTKGSNYQIYKLTYILVDPTSTGSGVGESDCIKNASSSVDDNKKNSISSAAKDTLDTWYTKNIEEKRDGNGKLLTDYISDGTFCNDRSIYSGKGYGLDQTTFSAYNRLVTYKTPSLTACTDSRDNFSTTSSYGNANLSKPVGLLTADEIVMAGGKYGTANSKYYLYTNSAFWTMTPSNYDPNYIDGYWTKMFLVQDNGSINNEMALSFYGIRPVINLKRNVYIADGVGSTSNPYKLAVK